MCLVSNQPSLKFRVMALHAIEIPLCLMRIKTFGLLRSLHVSLDIGMMTSREIHLCMGLLTKPVRLRWPDMGHDIFRGFYGPSRFGFHVKHAKKERS